MSIVTAFSDSTPGGTADSPKTGDLSGCVTAGSTNADIRVTNTGDTPCSFNWRDTGTTPFYQKSLLPLESVDLILSLTAARTFEYYFDASSLQVDVAYFFGTGLSSTVSLSDIEAWLTMHGHIIGASGDITSAQVQLCLNEITTEVTMAATRYALIAQQTLNASFKNHVILKGTVAQALYALRGKSGAQGLRAEAIQVNSATADNYMGEYRSYIERIMSGIFYGA
jgi:hypothetical protein